MSVPKNMSLCSSLKSYTKEQTLYEFTIPNPNIAIYIYSRFFVPDNKKNKQKKEVQESSSVFICLQVYW